MDVPSGLSVFLPLRDDFYQHEMFACPLTQPPYCRDVAWVILVIWGFGACITAVCFSSN